MPIDFAHLVYGDSDLSQAGIEGLVFVAVGMACALLGRLVQRRSAALEKGRAKLPGPASKAAPKTLAPKGQQIK